MARQLKIALMDNDSMDFEKHKDVLITSVEFKAEDYIFKTIKNANDKIFNGTVQTVGAKELLNSAKNSVNDLLKEIKHNEFELIVI